MRSYFEVNRLWPEGFCSVTITAPPKSKDFSHTSVYKRVCDAEFLKHYGISRFLPGSIPDVLPNNNGWLLISPKGRKLMEQLKAVTRPHFELITEMFDDCVNDFPVELRQYSLISTKAVFDCIDLDSPEISWYDESKKLAESFTKLPLLNSHLPDGPCFFGVKRAPCVFVVSEEFRDSMIQNKITGLRFKQCVTSHGPQ
jgi:hypothetical protein